MRARQRKDAPSTTMDHGKHLLYILISQVPQMLTHRTDPCHGYPACFQNNLADNLDDDDDEDFMVHFDDEDDSPQKPAAPNGSKAEPTLNQSSSANNLLRAGGKIGAKPASNAAADSVSDMRKKLAEQEREMQVGWFVCM